MNESKQSRKSGNRYISARMRGETYPLSNEAFGIKITFHQLDLVPSNRCAHVQTMCPTRECIESWGLGDWQLFLERTNAGRQLIEDLGLTEEDLELLKMESFPTFRHLPSTIVNQSS